MLHVRSEVDCLRDAAPACWLGSRISPVRSAICPIQLRSSIEMHELARKLQKLRIIDIREARTQQPLNTHKVGTSEDVVLGGLVLIMWLR